MFKNIFIHLLCIAFFSVNYTRGLEAGSACDINGGPGKCLPARECLSARESFYKNRTLPKMCSFKEDVYICCATDDATESGAATTRRPTDGCEPITPVPAPEVGQKSWNKCLEYQENIMRPCIDIILVEGKFRNSKCNRDSLALIVDNGVYENEFPHMVLLGYGDDISSLKWLCEGVIVSERFILSAAVCSYHVQYGAVKYIRTGVLNVSDPVDASKLFKIKRIIKHPLYKLPKPDYNIALLEIDTDIPLGLSVIPACIDVGNLPSYTSALAIGWDGNDGVQSMLQKGFEHILQIEQIKCMYVVIGLEFTRRGNFVGIPFTPVSEYVPWIESIVWP